jgi:hypothetical protein
MMGFLYKKANSTAKLFNPDAKQALRIFIAVFVLAIGITFALSWFTTRALNSSTIPEEANIKYTNLKSVMVFSINFSFFLLVILSNVYSQALKKLEIFPYIFAIAFYILFILKDAYVISDYYIFWQKSMQLIHGEIPDFTQTALTKCFLGFAVTGFNAFMVWWGLRK